MVLCDHVHRYADSTAFKLLDASWRIAQRDLLNALDHTYAFTYDPDRDKVRITVNSRCF